MLSSMPKSQPNWCLKVDFQKVDQHAGGKLLIHDTKRRKDNQSRSLKLSYWWRWFNEEWDSVYDT